MKLTLLVFSLAFLSIIVSCSCDCRDEMDNAIFFTFKLDSTDDSFTLREIDTIIVYRLDADTGNTIDSAVIYDNNFTLAEHAGYFSEERFWNYSYKIQPQSPENFRITDIEIEGEEKGTFCRCYHNTKKKLRVNDQEYDFSRHDGGWFENQVELTK